MSGFDAIAHAMTTIATGGFSTHDLSIDISKIRIGAIAIVFMLLGSLPFVLYLKTLRRMLFGKTVKYNVLCYRRL